MHTKPILFFLNSSSSSRVPTVVLVAGDGSATA